MGSAIKAISKPISSLGNSSLGKMLDPLGLVLKPDAPKIEGEAFDLSREADRAKGRLNPLLKQSTTLAADSAPTQTAIMQQMGQAALGQGPSLAEAQLKAAQDRNLAQQLAATQATRGGSNALNTRTLLQNMGSSGRDLAQQSAIDKIQERQAAQGAYLGQLNNVGAQARGDIAAEHGYSVGAKTAAQSLAAANLASQTAAYQADRQQQGALIGGIGSAVGMMAGSDKKMKKDIESSDKDMKSFVEALSAKKYKYKEPEKPGRAEGERYGVLAQALEKSKAGKSIVVEGPDGKMVDAAQGLGLALASQAALNNRISDLEKVFKKKTKKDENA